MIAASPENEAYRLALAQFYAEKRQNKAMIEVLREAMKDLPEKYGAYEMLAKYYLERKSFDMAIKVLDQFTKRVQSGPDLFESKGLKGHYPF